MELTAMKRKIEDEAAKNFNALEKELLAGKGISYDFKTEIGFVDDRIEDHAKKNKTSFLVMDRNTNTKNKGTFDELVAQLRIPLILVP